MSTQRVFIYVLLFSASLDSINTIPMTAASNNRIDWKSVTHPLSSWMSLDGYNFSQFRKLNKTHKQFEPNQFDFKMNMSERMWIHCARPHHFIVNKNPLLRLKSNAHNLRLTYAVNWWRRDAAKLRINVAAEYSTGLALFVDKCSNTTIIWMQHRQRIKQFFLLFSIGGCIHSGEFFIRNSYVSFEAEWVFLCVLWALISINGIQFHCSHVEINFHISSFVWPCGGNIKKYRINLRVKDLYSTLTNFICIL